MLRGSPFLVGIGEHIMKNKLLTLISVLFVISIIGLTITTINLKSQIDDTNKKFEECQDNLSYMTVLVDNYKNDLFTANNTIQNLSTDLSNKDNEITKLEIEQRNNQREINNLRDYSDRIQTQYIEIRDSYNRMQSGFVSREALREWLENDHIDSNEYDYDNYNCENFARDLSSNANKDGYFIGLLEVVLLHENNPYIPDSWEPEYDYHAKNFVIIGNVIYEIEPQSDEIVVLSDYDFGW
jgi:type II secretory pathway pseudopilin PulG